MKPEELRALMHVFPLRCATIPGGRIRLLLPSGIAGIVMMSAHAAIGLRSGDKLRPLILTASQPLEIEELTPGIVRYTIDHIEATIHAQFRAARSARAITTMEQRDEHNEVISSPETILFDEIRWWSEIRPDSN